MDWLLLLILILDVVFYLLTGNFMALIGGVIIAGVLLYSYYSCVTHAKHK